MSAAFHLRVGTARTFLRVAGEGPPVLLLHGGGPGTSSAGWQAVAERLAARRCVYSPDYLGFGSSDAPDVAYGTPLFAENLLALLDILCLDRVPLIGHSMGAQVAISVALAHPERVSHLGLVAPGGRSLGLAYTSAGTKAIDGFAADPTEASMRTVVTLLGGATDDLADEVAKRMAIVQRPGILAAQRALAVSRGGGGASKPLGPALQALGIPMLLLWGEGERFNPPELGPKIREALPPGTRYELIAGAGHSIPKDQPDAVAAAIAALLDGD